MNFNNEEWLPTPLAARLLGISQRTLKRWANEEGFLEPMKHWVRGPFLNSTITWNVQACRETLHYRGIKADPQRISNRLNGRKNQTLEAN
jgi:hypothetical protein